MFVPVSDKRTAIQEVVEEPVRCTTYSMLGALRVVLDVTELSEIQTLRTKLSEMEEALSRLTRAYHFQETMRRFARNCLDAVNEGLYEGEAKQTCVNIFADVGASPDTTQYQIEEMLFIRPDEQEPLQDEDVEFLAKFFDDQPQYFEAYMEFCFEDPEKLTYELNMPDDGILLVEKKGN